MQAACKSTAKGRSCHTGKKSPASLAARDKFSSREEVSKKRWCGLRFWPPPGISTPFTALKMRSTSDRGASYRIGTARAPPDSMNFT